MGSIPERTQGAFRLIPAQETLPPCRAHVLVIMSYSIEPRNGPNPSVWPTHGKLVPSRCFYNHSGCPGRIAKWGSSKVSYDIEPVTTRIGGNQIYRDDILLHLDSRVNRGRSRRGADAAAEHWPHAPDGYPLDAACHGIARCAWQDVRAGA